MKRKIGIHLFLIYPNKENEQERENLLAELEQGQVERNPLRRILSNSISCIKNQDDQEHWKILETYMHHP